MAIKYAPCQCCYLVGLFKINEYWTFMCLNKSLLFILHNNQRWDVSKHEIQSKVFCSINIKCRLEINKLCTNGNREISCFFVGAGRGHEKDERGQRQEGLKKGTK